MILRPLGREYSHEMISSPWFLLLLGGAGASATMVGVWLVSIRIANASYVDVAWALGIAGTAVRVYFGAFFGMLRGTAREKFELDGRKPYFSGESRAIIA